jgi:hypothetical protein
VYFCTASETARDVATRYIECPLSSMTDHKFIEHALRSTDTAQLPAETATNELKYFVEVYMDDFIPLAIASSCEHLRHVANGVTWNS